MELPSITLLIRDLLSPLALHVGCTRGRGRGSGGSGGYMKSETYTGIAPARLRGSKLANYGLNPQTLYPKP